MSTVIGSGKCNNTRTQLFLLHVSFKLAVFFNITFVRTACNHGCCISGHLCSKWRNQNFCQRRRVSLKFVYFINSIQNGGSLKLWTCKTKKTKKQKRKKNGGCGTVKEKEPWCPSVTFPFPFDIISILLIHLMSLWNSSIKTYNRSQCNKNIRQFLFSIFIFSLFFCFPF